MVFGVRCFTDVGSMLQQQSDNVNIPPCAGGDKRAAMPTVRISSPVKE